ncbi:hypothetical protein NT6N_26540 [Oceaniferula spumae]|uniref:Uncharacterized protein n=1 Tax=Oceaniferula spumae TaxID=2979115 RepID=A0AAT9FNP2_9BACT
MKISFSSYTGLTAQILALVALQGGASAQTLNDVHPQGLFNTPQPGIDAPLTRTPADATSLKDHFHLSASAGVRYEDNIFLTSTNEKSDVITTISATLRFVSAEDGAAENTFSVAYSPSYSMYASDSDSNNLGHALTFTLGKEMPKTSIRFNLSYSKSSGSNRFVSGIVDHGSLNAGLSISHLLTGKTSLNLGFGYGFDNFGNGALFDNNSYNVRLGLRYQATGKISVGPYVSYRNTDLSDGGGSFDQAVYGYGVSATYRVTGKTTLTGSIGGSTNSFSDSGSGSDESALTWSIGANHQISEKTSIRASFYRNYKASYTFEDAGYLATGLALSATHTVSDRLSLYATVTYENDDYFRATNSSYRLEEDYYSLVLGSNYRFSNGLSVGANAKYQTNDSTQALNEFDGLSFGITASYNFW